MVTRAIITDTDLTNGKVQIRIPWLDGIASTSSAITNNNLCWASICCFPGMDIDYKVGDVVIVGFEDNNLGRPIVLGFLKLSQTTMDSRIYLRAKEASIEEKLTAPLATTIGVTEYQKIFDATSGMDNGTLGDSSSSTAPQLEAPKITLSGTTITWSAVDGASAYRIYCNNNVVADNISDTQYVVEQSSPGSYVYTVVAISGDGQYSNSPQSNSVIYVVAGEGTTKLASPSLQLLEDNSLSWSAIENADSYLVFRNNIQLTSTTETSYPSVINNLPNTIALYVVAISNSSDFTQSDPSNTVYILPELGEAVWHDALDADGNFVPITAEQVPDDEPFTPDMTYAVRMHNFYRDVGADVNYNCYGYALRPADESYSGQATDQWTPGDFIGDRNTSKITREISNKILQDLLSTQRPNDPSVDASIVTNPYPLNKKNVQWTTGIPDVGALSDSEHLFAFRQGFNTDGEVYDYHFLRYDKGIGWTHKSGNLPEVLILQDGVTPWGASTYNNVPIWTVEWHDASEAEEGTDITDRDYQTLPLVLDNVAQTNKGPTVYTGYAYAGTIIYFKYED